MVRLGSFTSLNSNIFPIARKIKWTMLCSTEVHKYVPLQGIHINDIKKIFNIIMLQLFYSYFALHFIYKIYSQKWSIKWSINNTIKVDTWFDLNNSLDKSKFDVGLTIDYNFHTTSKLCLSVSIWKTWCNFGIAPHYFLHPW